MGKFKKNVVTKMKCKVCNSKNINYINYDNHILDLSFKGILKFIIPNFNFLIPNYFSKIKDISSRKKNGFKGKISICQDCGYGVMVDIPSLIQLEEYYTNDYWDGYRQIKPPVFKNKYKKNQRGVTQSDFVLPFLNNMSEKKINILEIGAAGAWAVLNLRDRLSYDVVSLDVCEPGDKWKNYYKQAKINRVSTFFPFKNSKKYDYIHTSHWLEHVKNLNNTIDSLYEMLDTGGKLFIEVPNTEHYYWNLPVSDTPHIHFFTIKSLNKVFEKAGFKCLKSGEFGITFLDINNGLVPMHQQNDKGSYIRALYIKI